MRNTTVNTAARLVLPLLTLYALSSCRKTPDFGPGIRDLRSESHAICLDCNYLEQVYRDSMDTPTLLGESYMNPYTIQNMTEAYREVFRKDPGPLAVTHRYIKFSPANFEELARLEEKVDLLYDYPLDQRLISEGDYYVQPGKQLEDIPDYYTVLAVDEPLPSGIKTSVLADMHIPDDSPAWEDAALRRTGNLEDINKDGSDPIPTQPPPTPSPRDCAKHPNGIIMVQNELTGRNDYRAVTDAQVVVRRLLKIEKLRTDANGTFACEKYFHNRYTIVVKFKNTLARVSRTRPWAFHEQFFPIKVNFGKWSDLECRHMFAIKHPDVAGMIATSHWCAAITFNGVQEHRQMCESEGIGTPPKGLHITLARKRGAGHGNTYMLNQMIGSSQVTQATEIFLPSLMMAYDPMAATRKLVLMKAFKARSPDIRYGYGEDASFLTTDRYDELVYHELSHAGQYSKMNNMWWVRLGLAEAENPGDGFYGSCCTKYAPRIAMAEGWAYFMGHYLSDKKWKLESTGFPEQGSFKLNKDMEYFNDTLGLSSHIYFLEAYEPGRDVDPDRWIPKGLFYDLMDDEAEITPKSGIKDEVSGYTPAMIYHAMYPDQGGITDLKTRLLKENKDRQRDAVLRLFASYGY